MVKGSVGERCEPEEVSDRLVGLEKRTGGQEGKGRDAIAVVRISRRPERRRLNALKPLQTLTTVPIPCSACDRDGQILLPTRPGP